MPCREEEKGGMPCMHTCAAVQTDLDVMPTGPSGAIMQVCLPVLDCGPLWLAAVVKYKRPKYNPSRKRWPTRKLSS